MTKELRDLLWREHIREYLPDANERRKEDVDHDDLIERAIDRLMHRSRSRRRD